MKVYIFVCYDKLFSNDWIKVWYEGEKKELNDVEITAINKTKETYKVNIDGY